MLRCYYAKAVLSLIQRVIPIYNLAYLNLFTKQQSPFSLIHLFFEMMLQRCALYSLARYVAGGTSKISMWISEWKLAV